MKYRKGSFITVPNIYTLEGKPTEYQVLFMWLCSYANENGTCFPGRKAISTKTGIKSLRTVDKYIEMLCQDGLITKTTRYKEGTNEKQSNLYQVNIVDLVSTDTLPLEQELSDPSSNAYSTPGAPNGTITKPIINQTNITKDTNVSDEDKVTLPTQRGATPIIRLGTIYRDLWRHKYGYDTKLNYGLFGKKIKELLSSYSELQIAVFMIIFFNWKGIDGNSTKDEQFYMSAAYSIGLFANSIDKYEIYARNIMKYNVDDDKELYKIVGEHIKSL